MKRDNKTKTRKNRTFCALLLSCALLLCFAGCGSTDEKSPVQNIPTETAATDLPPVSEEAAVTVSESPDSVVVTTTEEPPQEAAKETAETNETPVQSAEETQTPATPDSGEVPEAEDTPANNSSLPKSHTYSFSLADVPGYSGSAYYELNHGVPLFTQDDYTAASYEEYSSLDSLGRCGVAIACVGTDIMPTEERGSIGSVKPSGWQTVKYDCVDGKYLYNRCHLIGFQLTGENANERNLITGTRYMNVQGMLPFENMVADYVKDTGNHVLYRVTPVFEGDNLVASGVIMEAWSVEDEGDGICFFVYAYNVQPGVAISYADGDSCLDIETTAQAPSSSEPSVTESTVPAAVETPPAETSSEAPQQTYILNTNSKKFHYPWCGSVNSMAEKNKQEYTGTRDDLISEGYDPCKNCNP